MSGTRVEGGGERDEGYMCSDEGGRGEGAEMRCAGGGLREQG